MISVIGSSDNVTSDGGLNGKRWRRDGDCRQKKPKSSRMTGRNLLKDTVLLDYDLKQVRFELLVHLLYKVLFHLLFT